MGLPNSSFSSDEATRISEKVALKKLTRQNPKIWRKIRNLQQDDLGIRSKTNVSESIVINRML